jgi:glycolate oxidase FAD binding subunit
VEHAPPDALAGLDVWGDVGPALEPMRRLKQELDPAGVLNPGRYVGGI